MSHILFKNYIHDDSISNEIDEKLTDSALGDSILVSITILFLQSKHIPLMNQFQYMSSILFIYLHIRIISTISSKNSFCTWSTWKINLLNRS